MDDDYYQYYYDEFTDSFKDHQNLDDGWIENDRSDAHHDANSYIRFLKTNNI